MNLSAELVRYRVQGEALPYLFDCDRILKVKGKNIRQESSEAQELLYLARRVRNKLMRLRVILQCTLVFSESGR